MNEKAQETEDIMKWMAEDLLKLELIDQLAVATACAEMVNKVKPIYLKYKQMEEGPMDFLFRM